MASPLPNCPRTGPEDAKTRPHGSGHAPESHPQKSGERGGRFEPPVPPSDTTGSRGVRSGLDGQRKQHMQYACLASVRRGAVVRGVTRRVAIVVALSSVAMVSGCSIGGCQVGNEDAPRELHSRGLGLGASGTATSTVAGVGSDSAPMTLSGQISGETFTGKLVGSGGKSVEVTATRQ